jgi:HK97 family phage portal protein
MALWDRITSMMALTPALAEPKLQTRAIDSFTDYPGLEEQLLRVQGLHSAPWRAASIREALGVPAIQRAVMLISDTVGSLTMEGYRDGVKMPEGPTLIQRPNPHQRPYQFYSSTAYNMASRGEAVWWIAATDNDGLASALVVVPAAELSVEPNPDDRLRPIVKWGDKTSTWWTSATRTGRFVQIPYLLEPGELRGIGPLQMANAAVSVAVEAQEFAANFYADGGYPSFWIKALGVLGVDPDTGISEADTLKAQFSNRNPNTPLVTDDGVADLEKFDPNPQGSQMLAARDYQNGDAARLFGMPGPLLEFSVQGGSLVYSNRTDLWRDFHGNCLQPHYLEKIEQTMSDLLTRPTAARFNTKALLRADIKTRFDVHAIAIDKGIYTAEVAAAEEGYLPGDVEFVAVPFSPPAAAVTALPKVATADEVRCDGRRMLGGILKPCNKLLAESAPFVGTCPRCGRVYSVAA